MDTVAVTGGSGTVGSAVLRAAGEAGYRTANIDLTSSDTVADEYIQADMRDAGDTVGALASADADMVVHAGTIPAPGNHPAATVFESNAVSSYNVLWSASVLGIEAVCLASSIHAIGSIAPPAPLDVDYLPVDERHPQSPREEYGLGKQLVEVVADGFGRQRGPPDTISTLRLPAVLTGEAVSERLPQDEDDSDHLRDVLFAYVHADDVADLVVAAIEADYAGHERFWASAPDTRTAVPTGELVATYYPDAEVRTPFGEKDSLISIEKASRILRWKPRRSWRSV